MRAVFGMTTLLAAHAIQLAVLAASPSTYAVTSGLREATVL